MSNAAAIKELNRQLARKINEEARSDPQSPYAGKFVGIANGQVVAVADSWDEVASKLTVLEPEPQKCFGLEASLNYDEVQEIWGMSLCRV